MNFGYTLAKEKHQNPTQTEGNVGSYGVSDILNNGLKKPIIDTLASHPLEHAEKNRIDREFQLNMNMLRNVQGIHAPMRIMMELKAFDNVGRLPFLASSNLGKEVLKGHDDYIDFNDVLNPPEVHEKLIRPDVFMDRKSGLI